MATFAYTNPPFVTLTKISSSVMNQYFADIKTFLNAGTLDSSNIAIHGLTRLGATSNLAAGTPGAFMVNDVNGDLSEALPGVAGTAFISTGASTAPQFQDISSSSEVTNSTLLASVNSNLLTVALKDAGGNNPSSASPILIGFRTGLNGTGTYAVRSVTSALSVNTVATGATFGLLPSVQQAVYVYAIDNAGSVELALAGSRVFDETQLYNTVAMSSGATDSQTLYSLTLRTGVAIRLLGYVSSTNSTPGTYVNTPTRTALIPGYEKKPRSEVFVSGSAGGAGNYGSSDTAIRLYSTIQTNIGTGIIYSSNSSSGSTFQIREEGVYTMTSTYGNSNANDVFGISKNSTTRSAAINNIAISQFLAQSYTAQINVSYTISVTTYLKVGDIIRAQDGTSQNSNALTTDNSANFRIVKVSD